MSDIKKDKSPKHDLFTFHKDEDGVLHVDQRGEDAMTKILAAKALP